MIVTALVRRSVVKALTYRAIIILLDFFTVFLLSGAMHIALTFTVVSNLYTSVVYLLHERWWAHIEWGLSTNE